MEGLFAQDLLKPLAVNAVFASKETTNRRRRHFGISTEGIQIRKRKVEENGRVLKVHAFREGSRFVGINRV